MISRHCGLFIGILLAALPLDCFAAGLEIMAEDASEPFSRADGTGYANDVVKAAFHAAGVEVKLDVVPYARCKRSLMEGKVAACFGMSWLTEFADIIVFSELPIFEVNADVFVRKDARLKIRRIDDFSHGSVLGIVNEYEYPESISGLQSKGVVLERGINELANLKMLARGRLDAAVVMTSAFERQLQRAIDAGVEPTVTFAFRSGTMKAYVGFSLKHPEGEQARLKFNEGYRSIIADGTRDNIRKQWMKETLH